MFFKKPKDEKDQKNDDIKNDQALQKEEYEKRKLLYNIITVHLDLVRPLVAAVGNVAWVASQADTWLPFTLSVITIGEEYIRATSEKFYAAYGIKVNLSMIENMPEERQRHLLGSMQTRLADYATHQGGLQP